MSVELNNEYTSYIDGDEYQDMRNAFEEKSFDDAYEILYEKVKRIVTIKCRTYAQGSELDDLIQEVNMRIFTRLNPMIYEPIEFFSRNGKMPSQEDLGKCFRNYVLTIAMNFLRGKYRKDIKFGDSSINDEDKGDFFTSLISSEKDLADGIIETEYRISIYQLCLRTLFKKNSKPYIVLGFCFNVLIYGAESDHTERGCASYTAEIIADKLLNSLRDEFCDYHAQYLRSIPSETIAPFDERLNVEHSGRAYGLYPTQAFYGANPEKNVADWTYSTRKSLLATLIQEPEIIEFLEVGYGR